MEQRIDFKSSKGFVGRDGFSQASAIEIKNSKKELFIQPVPAKTNQAPNCRIYLPRSPEVLRRMAASLRELADEIEGGGE